MQTCLQELERSGLAVGAQHLLPWLGLNLVPPSTSKRAERGRLASLKLKELAHTCYDQSLSGRFLRKLPLMAHARYLHGEKARIDRWVDALSRTVVNEKRSRDLLGVAMTPKSS